jgi:hypothetical protein
VPLVHAVSARLSIARFAARALWLAFADQAVAGCTRISEIIQGVCVGDAAIKSICAYSICIGAQVVITSYVLPAGTRAISVHTLPSAETRKI